MKIYAVPVLHRILKGILCFYLVEPDQLKKDKLSKLEVVAKAKDISERVFVKEQILKAFKDCGIEPFALGETINLEWC